MVCVCQCPDGHRGQQTLFDCVSSPKIDLEAQKFQNFLGEQPPDPPSCFCISVLQAAESWAWPGYKTRKRSVPMLCPGIRCALPTPLVNIRTFLDLKYMKTRCISWTNVQDPSSAVWTERWICSWYCAW